MRACSPLSARFFPVLALLAWPLVGQGACATTSTTAPGGAELDARPIDERDFHCARAIVDGSSPYQMTLAGPERDPALAAYLDPLPYNARRAAQAAGLEPLLARILRARAASSEATSVELLAMENELTLRVVAFHSQLLAAAFEAGCTADMIQKVLPDFTHKEQSRQLTITVASLVVGAVGSIVAGAWAIDDMSSRGPALIGVGAGVGTAVLGIAALTHQERSIQFAHSRNRLVPLVTGVDPDHLYPPFVFEMLTLPDASDGKSPRDELLEAWQRDLERSVPTSEQAAARDHLLGDGGSYDETLLTLRADMFEGLESKIQGLARDLELLNRSLVRSLSTAEGRVPPPSAPPLAH